MEEHFKEKTSGEAEVGSSCVEAPSFQNNMQFSVLCHKVPLVTNLRLLSIKANLYGFLTVSESTACGMLSFPRSGFCLLLVGSWMVPAALEEAGLELQQPSPCLSLLFVFLLLEQRFAPLQIQHP